MSNRVVGIAEETLAFVLDAARDTHPNEYMGLLRAERARSVGVDRDGLVVTDVLVIPGTSSNPVRATVRTDMIPNVRRVGSVHSHPNGVLQPSNADLQTFGTGEVHLILGHPYHRSNWKAYDRDGHTRELDVLDADLEDPEAFFDFDESDLDL